ncbi:LpxL/LpxP family acyltransferase, partial [Neisseria sp. P0016.S002]
PDQDFGRNDSIFVNFFGIQTATITGLSRIAGMTKAKIIPAIPTRETDNTVTLRFHPAWDNFPTENVEADTQRMNDFIEERVREHPEQYFWLHKRFKTRPEGESSFY